MMKIKFMMAAAIAALTFSACSKDESTTAGKGDKATLNINVMAPQMARATGAPAGGETVANYSVFVTDNTGEIQWSDYSPAGAGITGMEVTSNATHVYIVANAGDLTSGVTTKAALDAYVADMTGTGNQANVRWATGSTSSALSFAQNASGDLVASANVQLTFIAARITLKIVDNMYGDYDATLTDGSLVLKNVAVLNASRDSKLFGNSLTVSPAHYLTGIDAGFSIWPAAGSYTVSPTLKDAIAVNDFTTTYHYYVFENKATAASEFPTIVTIEAEFDGKTVYYPVHLAPYEKWAAGNTSSSVERGKSYDITITLSVDPTIGEDNGGNGDGGDGGGTVDPTVPGEKSFIDIDVTLNDWVPVILEKEF